MATILNAKDITEALKVAEGNTAEPLQTEAFEGNWTAEPVLTLAEKELIVDRCASRIKGLIEVESYCEERITNKSDDFSIEQAQAYSKLTEAIDNCYEAEINRIDMTVR